MTPSGNGNPLYEIAYSQMVRRDVREVLRLAADM